MQAMKVFVLIVDLHYAINDYHGKSQPFIYVPSLFNLSDKNNVSFHEYIGYQNQNWCYCVDYLVLHEMCLILIY